MQANTNVIKNRLAFERGKHASSSVGVSSDSAFGVQPTLGGMADASRTLFSQKAWQKSIGNVQEFASDAEDGVDVGREACF